MGLAWKEMARRRGRYVSVGAALLLINMLVLFLVSQLAGLLDGQTGALRAIDADLLTFEADVEQSLFRSSIPVTDAREAEQIDGIEAAGPVGVSFGTGRTDRVAKPDELFDMAVFGFEPGNPGEPTDLVEGRLPEADEAGVGTLDESARTDGVEIGDSVYFAESEMPIEVVGFVTDSQFQLQPTLWVDLATWQELQAVVRPERTGAEPAANVLALTIESGFDAENVVGELDAALPTTETLTVDAAIDALPGVSEQRQTFVTIIAMTYIAAAIVVTLFFALITLEKTEQIGILKAIGARNRSLASSVVVQGFLLGVPAFAGAVAVMLLVAAALPPDLPFAVAPAAWIVVGVVTIAVAVCGALLSFRRISRIDPANAIGGAGD